MKTWRHNFVQYRAQISWLLVVALAVLSLLPSHLHLHHLDDVAASGHDHAIDLHLIMDSSEHADATILSSSPDVLIKKVGDNPLLAVLLVALLFALLVVQPRLLQPADKVLSFSRTYYRFAPPLRAPPLH